MNEDRTARFLPISAYLESPSAPEPPLAGDARVDVAGKVTARGLLALLGAFDRVTDAQIRAASREAR
jgi:hypothetical protein